MQKVTLGGERLGSGKKQKVEMHGFERSTHDLGYLWRSTISPGTLVPFMKNLALPGDTFDINLGCEILTHPTVGPLFGSFKVQLDIFQAPIRLYQGQLHNNKLGIGMNMANVKLPIINLTTNGTQEPTIADPDNAQVNPSCILSYLGIRGIGSNEAGENITRPFNGVPFLAYWDIYKQYYSNKMEEIGYVIHKDLTAGAQTITTIDIGGDTVDQAPTNNPVGPIPFTSAWVITYGAGTPPQPEQVFFNTNKGVLTLRQLMPAYSDNGTTLSGPFNGSQYSGITIFNWDYVQNTIVQTSPQLVSFPLENIDKMREAILQAAGDGPAPFIVNFPGLTPYDLLLTWATGDGQQSPYLSNQEGLAIKTYQSDLFNNWLNTEWIDGPGGITEVTAIDTTGGSFTIDQLNISKKVYDMLNRVAVSGGTYDDWLDVNYDHPRVQRAESPIYHGGLIKELVFQEVISNSASQTDGNTDQPLGTLGGRGVLASKHKGGSITIKVDEPSYIIGIVSVTPRIDNSQGNDWDVAQVLTMDDIHKPMLDEIGFQELIQEQMAWWTTFWDGVRWNTRSAGKQPAWINYQTDVNKVRGNFAIKTNEMFMTLNRRYEAAGDPVNEIGDLTTYIDPVKFNQIFAQSSIDSQNFWTHIAVDITARRKMSARIMPNL